VAEGGRGCPDARWPRQQPGAGVYQGQLVLGVDTPPLTLSSSSSSSRTRKREM
jgi:hypothetical protein